MPQKTVSIAIIMDPISSITFYKDTSLALLLAAKDQGWRLNYAEMTDLYSIQDQARGHFRTIDVFDNANQWYEFGESNDRALSDFDVILMRKDPPFDKEFLYTTYLLEQAERAGTLVVNSPQSLRDCNEKIFATQFPQCTPPVLVARDMQKLRDFHAEQGDVIFKPLDGMGGTGIFRCAAEDPNVNVITETLSEGGKAFVMAQRYLPEIKQGDKRIIVVDGEAIPYCLARIPSAGETRGNLAAGGKGLAQALSERDQWIVDQVAPTLREKGLLFVGLDVIGDYLTEINVTSPTCVREIDKAFDTRIGERLMKAISKKLEKSS